MIIYRIESIHDKLGPFRKGAPYPHNPFWKQTKPQVDGVEMEIQDVCGCRSRADLKAWFPEITYDMLMQSGYRCFEFMVDEKDVRVCPTTRQVVFDYRKIKMRLSTDLY